MQKKLYLILFITSLLVTGCFDETEYEFKNMKIKNDLSLATPIGTSTIELAALLKSMDNSGLLGMNADSSLYLQYSGTFKSDEASKTYKSKESSVGSKYFYLINGEIPIKVPVWDKPLVGMDLKDGAFTITIKSGNISTSGKLIFTLNNTKKKSDNSTYSFEVPFKTSTNDTTVSKSLEDYTMFFDNSDGKTAQLDVTYKLEVETFSPTDSISVETKYSNLKFKFLWGNLGSDTILNSSQKISIGLLSNEFSKYVTWGNPSFEIDIKNSFGLSSVVKIDTMQVLFPTGVNEICHFSDDTVNFNKNSSLVSINKIVNPVITNLTNFNNRVTKFENSKIRYFKNTISGEVLPEIVYMNTDMFDKIMKGKNEIYLKMLAVTNTTATTNNGNDFVADTSIIKGNMKFTLPLYFKSKGFEAIDTIDLDIASNLGSNSSKINELYFRLSAVSTLPIDAELQILFADKKYRVLDSMYNATDKANKVNYIFKAGTLNNGKVTNATTKVTPITISNKNNDKRLESFKLTKKAIVKMKCITPQNGEKSVRFYNNYRLKITFGMQIKAEVESEL